MNIIPIDDRFYSFPIKNHIIWKNFKEFNWNKCIINHVYPSLYLSIHRSELRDQSIRSIVWYSWQGHDNRLRKAFILFHSLSDYFHVIPRLRRKNNIIRKERGKVVRGHGKVSTRLWQSYFRIILCPQFLSTAWSKFHR